MKTNIENIKRLKYAKAFCNHSLLNFTRYFFKEIKNKKFIVNHHHKTICDALDRVVKGECKRLIINVPPRYGKTELAVKNFMAYSLSINPGAKFIHLSYSDSLALDNSEETRDIVNSQPYKELFPYVEIKKDSNSKKKWYTTKEGGIYATSSGGQITGFGAGSVNGNKDGFGGAIIIDDPLKPDDLFSEQKRNRVNERFDGTVRSRVNSRDTPIIIIMQRLHEEDLCGHLLKKESEDWEVISLPVIDNDGNPLWEHKHNLEEIEQMSNDEEFKYTFKTQYKQEAVSLTEGGLFPEEQIKYFDPTRNYDYEATLGFIDVADEGRDRTSCPFGSVVGKEIHIRDVVFNGLLDDVTIPEILDKTKKLDAYTLMVEANNMGAMYKRNLEKQAPEDLDIRGTTSKTNKHTRILRQAPFILANCRFLPDELQSDEYKKFMRELILYNKDPKINSQNTSSGRCNDDAPDSLSGLVTYIKFELDHIFE